MEKGRWSDRETWRGEEGRDGEEGGRDGWRDARCREGGIAK